MANPCFLFENLFDGTHGTVTPSSEDASYPFSNCVDWRMGSPYCWRISAAGTSATATVALTGAMAPTMVVLANTNLADLSWTWKLERSDNGSSWTDVHAAAAGSNDINWLAFSDGSHAYWRVTLAGASAVSQLSMLHLGRVLTVPRGVMEDLDPWGEEVVADWAQSPGGMFLGANVRYLKKEFSLNYPLLTDAEFWEPTTGLKFDTDFLAHVRQAKPLWFHWNTALTAVPPTLCRVDGKIAMPFVGITTRRQLKMKLVGFTPL